MILRGNTITPQHCSAARRHGSIFDETILLQTRKHVRQGFNIREYFRSWIDFHTLHPRLAFHPGYNSMHGISFLCSTVHMYISGYFLCFLFLRHGDSTCLLHDTQRPAPVSHTISDLGFGFCASPSGVLGFGFRV